MKFTKEQISELMCKHAQKDNGLDSLMNAGKRRSSLAYKYFGTPLLWRYILMQGLS